MKKIVMATATISAFLLNASNSSAVTITAKSGNREDIQAAINSAPENATVIIPEGNFDFNGPKLEVKKNITISGSGNRNTVLKKTSPIDWFFKVISDSYFRLTNLVLDGGKNGNGVKMTSGNLNMRIDNSTFKNFNKTAIETNGNIKGVIDNNNFQENRTTDIVVYGDNEGAWKRPVKLGTDDAIYVENNKFEHKNVKGAVHSISSNHGSNYVFRYNTIDDGNLNTNPIDAHGNFFYGRGSRKYEIYGNKIKSGGSYQGMYIRGGTGVIYDNEFIGKFSYPIVLENYRSFKQLGTKYPAPDQINDLHIWNNKYEDKNVEPYIRDRGMVRQHIRKDRDYFMLKKSGYKAYPYPYPASGEQKKEDAGLMGSLFKIFSMFKKKNT
ncbi:MAG TPA: hypothetical protein VHP36_06205 [Chitinispirillaceae bacterium]|nr:hypothetical protein [Chitinispirillaceae bacterium]